MQGRKLQQGHVYKAKQGAFSTCEHTGVPADHPQDLQRDLSTLTQRDPSHPLLLVMLQPRWTAREHLRVAGAVGWILTLQG